MSAEDCPPEEDAVQETEEKEEKQKPKPKKKKKIAGNLAGDIKKKKMGKKKSEGKKKKKGKGKKKKKGPAKPKKLTKFKPEEEKEATDAFGYRVSTLPFKRQLEFFLNAMWSEHNNDKLDMYAWMVTMTEFGEINTPADTNDLDDFQSAKFLERHLEAMSVVERRKKFRAIDIDGNNRMGLLEYLVYHYNVPIITLMNRPQGTNQALKDAQKALNVCLKEIKKIEKEKMRLTDLIENGKGIKAIQAKTSLQVVLAQDCLPLNRAIITAEAKMRAAQNNTDLSSMGKKWMMGHELAMAKAYKPKGGLKKGRFSVSTA